MGIEITSKKYENPTASRTMDIIHSLFRYLFVRWLENVTLLEYYLSLIYFCRLLSSYSWFIYSSASLYIMSSTPGPSTTSSSSNTVGGGGGGGTVLSLPPRTPTVSATPYDLLQSLYISHILRNHADGRFPQEEVFSKLELLGYSIGKRYIERLTKERERFLDTLDIMKFICREFWTEIFRKAIDKLQTNNRGTFVLQDFNFRSIKYISGHPDEDTKAIALSFMVLPCGIIRGALSGLGLESSVHADISALPRVVFSITLTTLPLTSSSSSSGLPSSSSLATTGTG